MTTVTLHQTTTESKYKTNWNVPFDSVVKQL